MGCAYSPGSDSQDKPAARQPYEGKQPLFQLIYVIHGDASYSYHDPQGRRHYADQEAIAQAIEVAHAGLNAEIFIFHQKPARTRFFFPVKNGILFHFRFGEKVREETYLRYANGTSLGSEVALYRTYSASAPVRILLYFGHEIPERDGRGYSASYPSRNFSLAEFTRGLQEFALTGNDASGSEKPFALLTLSSCKGGSPVTLGALGAFTDYILASPGDLHLSYMDTRAFMGIFPDPKLPFGKAETRSLASEMARNSFDKLKEATQTEITVGLWEDGRERVEFLHHPPRFGPSQFSEADTGTYRRSPKSPTKPTTIK